MWIAQPEFQGEYFPEKKQKHVLWYVWANCPYKLLNLNDSQGILGVTISLNHHHHVYKGWPTGGLPWITSGDAFPWIGKLGQRKTGDHSRKKYPDPSKLESFWGPYQALLGGSSQVS